MRTTLIKVGEHGMYFCFLSIPLTTPRHTHTHTQHLTCKVTGWDKPTVGNWHHWSPTRLAGK